MPLAVPQGRGVLAPLRGPAQDTAQESGRSSDGSYGICFSEESRGLPRHLSGEVPSFSLTSDADPLKAPDFPASRRAHRPRDGGSALG